MAQTHAQQCVFKHDTCRNVGKNIFYKYLSLLHDQLIFEICVIY